MEKVKINKVPTSPLKRLFDIVFALVFIIVTSPLFIIIFLALLIEHALRGQFLAPLFYFGRRVTAGREFNFIKFNVYDPAKLKAKQESGQPFFSKQLEWENGFSKVGRLAQRVYLDELPQLLNIIKGDMSVVGPRPVNVIVYKKILERGMTTKAEIRAGFTGPYQSHKGEPGMNQDRLDREYIEFCRSNPSWRVVLKDIGIILRTVRIVGRAQGL